MPLREACRSPYLDHVSNRRNHARCSLCLRKSLRSLPCAGSGLFTPLITDHSCRLFVCGRNQAIQRLRIRFFFGSFCNVSAALASSPTIFPATKMLAHAEQPTSNAEPIFSYRPEMVIGLPQFGHATETISCTIFTTTSPPHPLRRGMKSSTTPVCSSSRRRPRHTWRQLSLPCNRFPNDLNRFLLFTSRRFFKRF
jgi:hypothetical protein